MTKRLIRRFGVLLSVLVGTVACVGLGGEPQIISTRLPAPTPTVTPVTPALIELGYPAVAPDLNNGRSIYAQHCAGCHGDTGAGDGPVARNANLMPKSFLDPATAQSQTPHEWFSTITNGRIENLMPPWKDALSEQERWDVAMYTYTLHVTPEQLVLGETLYQDCAECHGVLGKGDGPEVGRSVTGVKDLTDQSAMVTLSDESMYKMVTQGFEEVMPSYADVFSESERWAVVAYARSLSLTRPQTAVIGSDALTFTGTVTLFGADALPAGLSVSLRAFDAQTGQPADLGAMMPTPVNADGTYTITDIAKNLDLGYFTTVNYEGYPFASAPVQPVGEATTLTVDIVLYDATNALTDVTATAWVNQITAYDGLLEVVTVVQVQNLSESKMFSTGEFLPDGRPIAFTIPIPAGATLIPPDSFSQEISSDGLEMIDTQALPPRGQKLLTARYTLPYTVGQTLSLPTNLTVGGVVRVLVRPLEMSVSAEMLPPLGEEFIGGEFYKSYGDQIALLAGKTLDITLNGQPLPADAVATEIPLDSSTTTPAGTIMTAGVSAEILTPILALLGLAVVVMTAFLIFRRKS